MANMITMLFFKEPFSAKVSSSVPETEMSIRNVGNCSISYIRDCFLIKIP